MKDWHSAGDQIRRRSFTKLVESLSVETPFAFDPVTSISEMPDFIEANWETFDGQPDKVMKLPGRDMNFARDCLISVRKFLHVLECARAQFDRGALTWMTVDAYHASLLGARAICALFGVLSYTARGRTVLVDFRPEFGSVDDMKKFRKKHHETDSLVRVLQPASRLMEQKDSWSLLIRICNVCDSLEFDEAALKKLAGISAEPLSQMRNLILYDSVFWQWRKDFATKQPARDDLVKTIEALGEPVATTVSAVTYIFATVKILAEQFCEGIGLSPASLGTLLSVSSAPNIIVAVK